MIALRNKTVVHAFLPLFDDSDGRLCTSREVVEIYLEIWDNFQQQDLK